jgi:hypothetical protein
VDPTAARAAAGDVLDADAATREASIGGFFAACAGSAAWLAGWPDDLDVVECARQEAPLLEPPTARRQGIGSAIRNALVMGTPRLGLTAEEDRPHGVAQQHIVDRGAPGLAAIIAPLLRRSVGTPDAPCGALRPNRGEAGTCADVGAGGAAGCGGSCTGTTSALASVWITPRRFASAVMDRGGASPRARSVACRTGNKT